MSTVRTIPIGVTKLAARMVGLLPYKSITRVINILPMEKLRKLTAPNIPTRYGSTQIRSSCVIQLFRD